MANLVVKNYSHTVFKWRTETHTSVKIALALTMAAVTGLMAQVRVPLPFTPVPITGQTFAVLLAGVLLGKNWGGISQVFYVVIGAAGIPWFSGMTGGTGVLLGPTGGYIAGFLLAAFCLGYLVDTFPRLRNFVPMLGLMLTTNFVLIFGPGLIQLALWLSLVRAQAPTLTEVLALGLTPFIPGALIKSLLAAAVASTLLPKHQPLTTRH